MIWAYVTSHVKTIAIAAGLIVTAFLLGQCDGRSTQKAKDTLALSRAEAAALRINAAATRIAEGQRAADTARITTQDKERLDAIQSAPPSRTGAATRSLGCIRLRQAGRDRDAASAGC